MEATCDCCGLRAYVELRHAARDQELTFCAHHYAATEQAMRREGWHVEWDRRDELAPA